MNDEIDIGSLRVEFRSHRRTEDLQLLNAISLGGVTDFIEMLFNCWVHGHRDSSYLYIQSIATVPEIRFLSTLPV